MRVLVLGFGNVSIVAWALNEIRGLVVVFLKSLPKLTTPATCNYNWRGDETYISRLLAMLS